MTTTVRTTLVDPSGDHTVPGVRVHAGPRLLGSPAEGPTVLPALTGQQLQDATQEVSLHGRGGAGFPFARKLEAVRSAGGRPTVVVNLSEGEPASFKDVALALVAPHLVLDGAVACARALRVRTVHLVVPGEHPAVERALRRALAARSAGRHSAYGRLRWRLHRASAWFVAGQARAVIELMSGRADLPVTSWQPEAYAGYRGRPTLLSNAETYAQVGEIVRHGPDGYAALGTPDEPGTTLLTLYGDTDHPEVVEVPYGTAWGEVLTPEDLGSPILLGGYHGTWAGPAELAGQRVSRAALRQRGLTLGAGVVLPAVDGECPLHRTAEVVSYLAGQSAGRCGPCLNGLPALATTLRGLAAGRGSVERAEQLTRLVTGRGACAHPDGTARLVTSLLRRWPGEAAAHARGECRASGAGVRS